MIPVVLVSRTGKLLYPRLHVQMREALCTETTGFSDLKTRTAIIGSK